METQSNRITGSIPVSKTEVKTSCSRALKKSISALCSIYDKKSRTDVECNFAMGAEFQNVRGSGLKAKRILDANLGVAAYNHMRHCGWVFHNWIGHDWREHEGKPWRWFRAQHTESLVEKKPRSQRMYEWVAVDPYGVDVSVTVQYRVDEFLHMRVTEAQLLEGLRMLRQSKDRLTEPIEEIRRIAKSTKGYDLE